MLCMPREPTTRNIGMPSSCAWYIKQAGAYCHSAPIRGEKFCKQHRGIMRKWIGKKHRASYAKANNVSEFASGYSKFK